MRKVEWKFVDACRGHCGCNGKVFENADKTLRHYMKIFYVDWHLSERKEWDINVLDKMNTRKGRGVALQH